VTPRNSKHLKKRIVMVEAGNEIKVVKKKTWLQVMLQFQRKLKQNKYTFYFIISPHGMAILKELNIRLNACIIFNWSNFFC
jgi:hypothetical protein